MSARPRDNPLPRRWPAALVGLAWISPWLVGFTVFVLLPVLVSGYLSFCQFDGLRPPLFTGLENLRTLADDPLFWKTLKTTSIYAAIALPLGTLVALALAVLLNAKVPGQTVWRAVIFVPTLVPLVATAMIWLWMFNGQFGVLNVLLRRLGIEGPNWLTDPH
jgi:multiple sugar transport system permease protein